MIRKLNKKDKISFIDYCSNLTLNEATYKFNYLIKKNCISYVIDNGQIEGILYIEKIDNKKFLQLIVPNTKIIYYLLKNLFWNHNLELFWEINNNLYVGNLTNKFKFFQVEKKENSIIYCRKSWKKEENQNGNSNYSKYHYKD